MKPDVETKLRQAAKTFRDAPANLQEAIFEAAADPDTDAVQIAQAIDYAYGVDYVRKLIRDARKGGKIPQRPGS